MSRAGSTVRDLMCVAVVVIINIVPAGAQGTSTATADQRLRELYSSEWTWRQGEFARGDNRFPRVDAASQEARLAYWTRALATLDSIPFDQLSPDEKVNAQVFRAAIRALADDVRFRIYEAPFNSDTFFWTDFTPRQVTDIELSGMIGSVAHLAYHLGAMRQINRNARGPKEGTF